MRDPVTGSSNDHVQTLAGKAAARSVMGHLLGPFAVNLRVRGIAQPQLDAGADLILERRSDLRPARCRQHHMHTERKSLGSKSSDRCLKRLELMTQAPPAVDHEEYLTERVVVSRRIASMGLPRSDD